MKKISVILLLFAMFLASLNATTYRKTKLSHLINTSTTIIKGQVVGVKIYWATKEKKNIFRDVTIEVESTIKGVSRNTITVCLMGGQIGDLKQEIDDVPDLKNGDKGVFFLVNHKNKTWIHSLALGYFQIIEADTNEDEVIFNKFKNSVIETDINVHENGKYTSSQYNALNEFVNAVSVYLNKGKE